MAKGILAGLIGSLVGAIFSVTTYDARHPEPPAETVTITVTAEARGG